MSQNYAAMVAKAAGGSLAFMNLDGLGNLLVDSGAQQSALNVTAQGVIKAGAGRFYGLIVNAPGSTSGGWSLNDTSTVGGIAAANLIGQVLYNATANVAGAVLLMVTGGLPFTNGLVITVPGGGSPIATVLYS